MDGLGTIERRGVVAVVVRAGRLLVIRRSQLVAAPGKLCFPGGGIEPHESDEAALVRELREELAVTVRPVRKLWESVTSWRVALSWWLADLPLDAMPVANAAEVAAVDWHTPGDLACMPDLLESNHQFLALLERGEVKLG